MKKKVVVGMSGGVDSAVCAFLLKEAGFEVIGVTMRLWEEEDEACLRANHVGCCGKSAVEDAMRVAGALGIVFSTLDLREVFRRDVVDYFENEYLAGRTPNPCIACNKHLKWGAMRQRAREMGADYIATGHYARVVRCENGRFAIKRSATAAKDQTYVLYHLSQEELAHTLMPVGDYTKDEIRQIAADHQLVVADKRDSQDICFIPDGDYGAFLKREIPERLPGEGDFVDRKGRILGKHKGITNYTIGQRKGLGIALGYPVFVNEIDAKNNKVVLGANEECFRDELVADAVCHMSEERFDPDKVYSARIRYSHEGAPCRVLEDEDRGILTVRFREPVRAITPGQAVVIYDGDLVAGGGTILR